MYTIRQTDCRTGWQVIDARGRPIATYRRRDPANDHAREMNRNPFTLTSYVSRPTRIYVNTAHALVNRLTVCPVTSRITWAQDWAQIQDLVSAGVVRSKSYGPGTMGHTEVFIVR